MLPRRPSACKAGALLVELSEYLVSLKGVEPSRIATLEPKSSASANSATETFYMVRTERFELSIHEGAGF